MKSSTKSNGIVPLVILVLAIVAFGFVLNRFDDASSATWRTIVAYNCTESGGVFSDDACRCGIDEALGQTQENMYDKTTGYCQTTIGGAAGRAGRP